MPRPRTLSSILIAGLLPLSVLVAVPAAAQVRSAPVDGAFDEDEPPPPPQVQTPPTPAGRIADSSAGQAGQRRTRDGATATARLSSRIQNRVQSRLRNRIDRNYDPQANAASPFAVAEDQARTAGRTRR